VNSAEILSQNKDKWKYLNVTYDKKKYDNMILHLPVPVAAPSKAWVCGLSLAEIEGSITAGGMEVCLL
jgi:hypothetical protein